MKKYVVKILVVIVIVLLFGMKYLYDTNETMVPILGYHGIAPSEEQNGNEMVITTDNFERQLKILKKMNYKTLTLDEYYCWKKGECKKPHRSVLITFDDGYQNNYEYAFPILKKYNMNAVVFYIGSNWDVDTDSSIFMDLDIIEKSKEEYPNIEFASHSYEKHNNSIKTYEEINNDIKKMDNVLDTKYYAYPHGEYSDEYIQALKDNDYVMAFTFGPDKEHRKSSIGDDNYKIPRLNIFNSIPDWKFKLRLILPI